MKEGRGNTYLSTVVDRKVPDDLTALVVGHFEIALELEQEELRGTQLGKRRRKRASTRGGTRRKG